MNWNELRKKTKNNEMKFIGVMIAILSFALMGEIIVENGKAIIYIMNYDTISLTVIQIQATVQTLSIALLALISGEINDSHMGINRNDFLFNIRPCIFSQRRIVNAMIILLVVNVFFHMFGFYNLVIALFLVSCILILISVKEIYVVLMGHGGTSTDLEIEAYLLSFTNQCDEVKQIEGAMKKICKGWRYELETQGTLDYEKYQKMFNAFLDRLLVSDEPDVQKFIEKETSDLVKCFCKSKNKVAVERSLKFLYDFYEKCWSIISNNKEKANNVEQGIHLLSESYFELSEAISELSVQDIEKNIRLSEFVDIVVLCNLWMGYDVENDIKSELRSLTDLVVCMEWQLENVTTYNSRYWGEILEELHTSTGTWPVEKVSLGKKEVCNIKLNYAILLTRMEKIDILKESYFDMAVKHFYSVDSDDEIKLYLKIQCYLFYLAYYENVNFVSSELKNKTQNLLLETKNTFSYVAERIEEFEEMHPKVVFNESLAEEIFDALRIYEYYPRNREAKMLVMEDAATDFAVFLSMYLANRYYNEEIMYNIIAENNNISLYMRYFQDNKASEMFSKFLQIIDSVTQTDIMLIKFQRILKSKIKSSQIERAHEEYLSNINNKEDQNTLKQKLKDYLNKIFNPIISEDTYNTNTIKVPVFRLGISPSASIATIIDGEYDAIAGCIINALCCILTKTNAVDCVQKSSFQDDEELFAFISSEENDIVIGSAFSMRPSNYRNRERLNEILSEKKLIMEGFTNNALLIHKDALHIFIHDIEINTHSGTYADEREHIDYNPATQLYSYEVMNGIPIEFTKDELLQYLHDKRKIVDIDLYISVKRKEGKIGTMLMS